MYRREWLAATAAVCSLSVAGCGTLLEDEQPPADSDDERPGITESQRAAVVEEMQAVEQSTTEEVASTEASAESEITDIRDDTTREIALLEGRGENWLKRSDSQDRDVLVNTIEDFVDRIRGEAERGRERIQTVVEREQAAIEQAKGDGQAEIEGVPESMLDGEPDDEIQTEVQTAVDNLETSARNATENIETTAVEERAAITETAQTSIANLETKLEEGQ